MASLILRTPRLLEQRLLTRRLDGDALDQRHEFASGDGAIEETPSVEQSQVPDGRELRCLLPGLAGPKARLRTAS